MSPAVIVPVKAFHAAKARLRAALSDRDRAALAERMATSVVAAAGELAAFVVCDDEGVAEWATRRGASVVWQPHAGLNAAVEAAVDQASAAGFRAVIIAHSDLPLVESLAAFDPGDSVMLAPDHRLDGTNVMAFPLHLRIAASYGPGSFRRHLAAALAGDGAVRVLRSEHTGRDVDTPDDLGHPPIACALREWAAR